MRKFVLLVAAVPLVFSPPAFASDKTKPERHSVCRVPDVDVSYDTESYSVMVSLPASGCRTREHTMFELSVAISRFANHGADRDLVQRTVTCGPFRSADDFGDGEAPQYLCNLAVSLGHPEEENAEYAVDVTYPGAAANRTMSLFSVCTSDGQTAYCEK